MGSELLTKGAKAFDLGSGLLPNPNLQAQPHRKHLSPIKNQKAFTRSLSQTAQPNSDCTSFEKLPSANSSSLPPSQASSPIRVPVTPLDPAFKFSASPCGIVNHPNDWSELIFSGDRRAIPPLSEAKAINDSRKVGESLILKANPNEQS
nr:hypothetical protein CFP56_61738 [Quercus suber]